MCKEVVIKIVVALKIVDGSQKVYFCKCISHLQQLLVSYA